MQCPWMSFKLLIKQDQSNNACMDINDKPVHTLTLSHEFLIWKLCADFYSSSCPLSSCFCIFCLFSVSPVHPQPLALRRNNHLQNAIITPPVISWALRDLPTCNVQKSKYVIGLVGESKLL